jgi:hypothetical protein
MALIAELPLTKDEKAEAVRRLLGRRKHPGGIYPLLNSTSINTPFNMPRTSWTTISAR